MYVSVLTVRIITRSGGNGAASVCYVCYAVCACGSTVRDTCIHATRGGKSACLYCNWSSGMYWCIIACEADKYFLHI